MSDTRMSDGERLFLAVVAFLVIRGLLKASEANDRKRVKEVYDRLRRSETTPPQPSLFGTLRDDIFG